MSSTVTVRLRGGITDVELNVNFLAHILHHLPDVPLKAPIDQNGTENNPFQLRTINEWAWAAANQTSAGHEFYLIAGHMIQRSPPGNRSDYTVDILDAGKVNGVRAGTVGADHGTGGRFDVIGHYRNQLPLMAPRPAVAGAAGRGRGRGVAAPVPVVNGPTGTPVNGVENGWARAFPAPPDNALPAYSVKYNRIETELLYSTLGVVDDRQLARTFRRTLKGDENIDTVISEIPGTIASMFLSEVFRQKRMLLIGLMLIDLIEAGQDINGIPCTFRNAMYYIDGPHPIIAMHPMFSTGSVAQSRGTVAWNNVWKKSIDIFAAWFRYIARTRLMYTSIDTAISTATSLNQFQDINIRNGPTKSRIYHDIMMLLYERIASLNFMR